MIVGAGAVGNETLKNLALLGIGRVTVVDFDLVEESNLSRCVLFGSRDVGKSKAAAAAAAMRRINPDIKADAVEGDLELDVGIGTIMDYNVVLGCVDSVNARWAINRVCFRAGVPWINAGINENAAEVAVFDPKDGSCYECSMTDTMWARFHQRRSCTLLLKSLPPTIVPTTAIVASLAAALQVNEAIALLHGRPSRLRSGQKLFFGTNPYTSFIVDLPFDPECPSHERWIPDVELRADAREMTVRDLLRQVNGSTHLSLNLDLLVGLDCANCGGTETCIPVKRAGAAQLVCPGCGRLRSARFKNEIRGDDALCHSTLKEVGIPNGAVLEVHTATGSKFVRLSD
jgi:adenylyltransferase/sulfurtransferase